MNEVEAHPIDLRARVRKIIHEIDTPAGKAFDVAIIIAIIASVGVVIFTIDPGMEHWAETLNSIEWFFTILFTMEYALRLWTVNSLGKYALSFFGIIDLLAILPAYISLIPGAEIEYLFVLRALRMLRIIRILKLIAAVSGPRTIVSVALALIVGAFIWYFLRAPDRTVLLFSTGSEDGLYDRLAKQMKIVIETNHPDLRIELKHSAGSNENIRALDTGKVQLGLVQNDAFGGKSVRSLAALYPEVLHLISRTNANIRTLRDLSGKRVGIGAPGSGTAQITTKLLDFSNVSIDDNQTRPSSLGDTMEQLEAGKIDAAFFLTGLGSSTIGKSMTNKGLRLSGVQIRESGAGAETIARQFTDGFRVHYPHVAPDVIPQMAYQGRPVTPVPSLSVWAVLACKKDVDKDIIGRITRTLFTQRAVLSQNEPAFSYLDESRARSGLQFPLHEGAENFYHRKEPGFFAENAELMGFVLTLVLLVWSGADWIRNWYLQRQKNRIDTYYEAVDDVIRRLHDGTDLEEIDELEGELLKIRQRASGELVHEKLAADESYIIYQNMLNGCQGMLVRMREKIQASPEKDA